MAGWQGEELGGWVGNWEELVAGWRTERSRWLGEELGGVGGRVEN